MARKRKSVGQGRAKSKAVKLDCWLLQLPREIRDELWINVFSNTRLTHGRRRGRVLIKPAPHSLAILRVCKQISQETNTQTSGARNEENKAFWIRYVLFNFEDLKTMLDKLSFLPSMSLLSQIRHMRIVNHNLEFRPAGPRGGRGQELIEYGPTAALMLLPGLCLDRLTLMGRRWDHDFIVEWTLHHLAQNGNGWKELHYIIPFVPDLPSLGCNWSGFLPRRDGADSGASFDVYRSTVPNVLDAVSNPSTREVFNVRDPRERDYEKSSLVVLKRGRHANVSEPNKPSKYNCSSPDFGRPGSFQDIRRWTMPQRFNFTDWETEFRWTNNTPRPVWSDIERKGIWTVNERPQPWGPPARDEPAEEDSYKDIDEWPWI